MPPTHPHLEPPIHRPPTPGTPRATRPARALRPRQLSAGALWLALCASATGCVRVYQPMSGLHDPVVVDTRAANFADVRLAVHCVPEDLLSTQEASALCQKVGALFENQGAEVRTIISAHESLDDAPEDEGDEAPGEAPTDLTLVLRARRIHQANNPLLWALCAWSFTLVPAITESTFAQDVIVRDSSGFLLVSESLEGRLVRYFGLGSWVGNKFLDVAWRDEEDKLTGDVFERDLSTDLYRRLSQLVFNAKVQWQVLQEAPTGRPSP